MNEGGKSLDFILMVALIIVSVTLMFVVTEPYLGSAEITNTSQISDFLGCLPQQKCISSPHLIKSSDKTYAIVFSISDGRVQSINLSAQKPTLRFDINPTNEGNLTVTIPRELIDSKSNSITDAKYQVLADSSNLPSIEMSNKDDSVRTLQIHFLPGTKNVEIIGNQTGPGLQKYHSEILGLKMYYPSDWKRIENVTTNFGDVIFYPKNADSNKISLKISGEVLGQKSISLEQYAANKFKDTSAYPGLHLEESGPTIIANNSAYKAEYLSSNNQRNDSFIWLIRNGVGYTIHYNSIDQDLKLSYLPAVNKIVQSLELIHLPKLSLPIYTARNPVPAGQNQNITVRTLDAFTNKAVPSAKLDFLIRYASGLPLKFESYTDKSGVFSYLWNINDKSNSGTFTVSVNASKLGYQSISNESTFKVIPVTEVKNSARRNKG